MLSWFWPKSPLGTMEKVWVEARMTWLTQQLGAQRLLQAEVVEPTEEFFPGEYRGTEGDAQRVFEQLTKRMQIEPGRVQLQISDQLSTDEALGDYSAGEPATIRVRSALLETPESLVATMTHELCHEILLGGGLLQDNNDDLERLTDLLQVFLGLGIFGANDSLQEQNLREGRFSWWSIGKRGYLPMRMYGYGMALYAWARDENDLRWIEHLRPDVREPLEGGLRYLQRTGDSTFQIDTAESEPETAGFDLAASRLAHRSPSHRLLGLWDLLGLGTEAAPAAASIARLLDDRDSDISSLAARTLGVLGPSAAVYVPQLQDLLRSRRPGDREAAAFALGEIAPSDPDLIQDLGRLLEDNDRAAQSAAIVAIGRFGVKSSRLMPGLLRAYQRALTKCDHSLIDPLAVTLQQVDVQARQLVRDFLSPLGQDMLHFGDECMTEAAMALSEAQHADVIPAQPDAENTP